MAYSSLAIANFFIEKALQEKSEDLTPMKLQKLVYFAHGWFLALKKSPLLVDRIQAWQYGPVIKDLYHETKKWGNSAIDSLISIFDGQQLKFITPKVDDAEIKDFLQSIWVAYSKHSAIKLSNATHLEGSPWDITIKENKGDVGRNIIIDDNTIQTYFSKLVNNAA